VVEQANPNLEAPPEPDVTPDQGEGEGQPEEVNWEERATAAETENTKLKGDLSTAEGRVRKQTDIDAVIAGFGDRLDGIQAGTAAMARAMANDDLDGLGEEVDAIEQRTQARSVASARQSVSASLGQDLQLAVQGSDGEPVLDLMEAPELETVRMTWNTGLKQLSSTDAVERAEGRATLVQAISDAKTAALVAERTKSQKALTNLEAQHKADRAKWAEDNGVEDLSTGTGAAAAQAPSGSALEEGIGNGTIPATPANLKKLQELYRQEGFRR
jgi:predicted DNA-binding protein (UPF0251 family)|tara:strand:- start:595 stop:1410 length:816 start_codon:yes stop_codon:yes gene_type:complete